MAIVVCCVALVAYFYALVSMVLYTSLHEEVSADVRFAEGRIAQLEATYLQKTHALATADAAVFALVPAEEVVHVSRTSTFHLSRLD